MPRDATIVAIVRDGHVVVPRGDTVLAAGDEVLVLVTTDSEDAVRHILIGESPQGTHGGSPKLLRGLTAHVDTFGLVYDRLRLGSAMTAFHSATHDRANAIHVQPPLPQQFGTRLHGVMSCDELCFENAGKFDYA